MYILKVINNTIFQQKNNKSNFSLSRACKEFDSLRSNQTIYIEMPLEKVNIQEILKKLLSINAKS